MRIHTIGFTRKSAEEFFALLRDAGIRRLVDVRLSNTSQLAGFSKRDDLAFFLDEILGAAYEHRPELAPSRELLRAWRREDLPWERFVDRFRGLLVERGAAVRLDRADFEPPTVLLCSEHEPDRCHRRLVVEHLADAWGDVEADHLL